jgi:hypothetical protein
MLNIYIYIYKQDRGYGGSSVVPGQAGYVQSQVQVRRQVLPAYELVALESWVMCSPKCR